MFSIRLALSLVAVFFVPGAVLLHIANHPARGASRAALALGVSLAIWPVVFLWTSAMGRHWTAARYVLFLLVLVTGGLMSWLAGQQPGRRWKVALTRPDRTSIALLLILAIAVVARFAQIRGLVAPPWVDGLHHTIIAQLIADSGRLPADLRPFMPVDRFYYHFGFHALVAAVAWLSGSGGSMPAVVLWAGQALSAGVSLTVYLLALRLLGSRLPAVAAAAVPAALSLYPAYYVVWSRYTQLAGLVVLPVAWVLVYEACERVGHAGRHCQGTDRQTMIPDACALALAAATTAGLLLIHMRVFVFFLIGMPILAVSFLVPSPGRVNESLSRIATLAIAGRLREIGRLAIVGLLGIALAWPWIGGNLVGGLRDQEAGAGNWYSAPQIEAINDLPEGLLTAHGGSILMIAGLLGLGLGLLRRRRPAVALAAYLAFALALVNPRWLHLPDNWLWTPFSLAISAFMAVAMGVGLLVEAVADVAKGLVARRQRDAAVHDRVFPVPLRTRRLGATGAILVAAVLLCAMQAWQLRNIVSAEAVLVLPADLEAAAWIRRSTPEDARFLVGTTYWQLGAYRGIDGGYWLPYLARRATSIPPALYTAASNADVAAVTAVAEIALKGDKLSNAELSRLLDLAGAQYVYIGPAGAWHPSEFSYDRLRSHPELVEVYGADGAWVFRRLGPGERAPGR